VQNLGSPHKDRDWQTAELILMRFSDGDSLGFFECSEWDSNSNLKCGDVLFASLSIQSIMLSNMQKKLHYILVASLCLIPATAWANIGVPMIFVTMPAMLIGLIPIIAIEAYLIKNQLNLLPKKAIISSGVANALSTLIGVPLTWGALVLVQMVTGGGGAHGLQTFFQKFLAVTWQAPWLIPYESDLAWMIPTAMLVLLIPFFLVSWRVEYFIIKKMNKQIDAGAVKATCLKANAITYALFALYPLGLYFLN